MDAAVAASPCVKNVFVFSRGTLDPSISIKYYGTLNAAIVFPARTVCPHCGVCDLTSVRVMS